MGIENGWTRKFFDRLLGKAAETDEVWALTQQFHVTLQSYITKVEETIEGSETPPPRALSRIREIVGNGSKELTWKDAYDIEQQLVHLYDGATLDVELDRRMLEAQVALHESVAGWYKERVGDLAESDQDPDHGERRALLSRLINDLQWRFTRSEARRYFTKQITTRTGKIFVGAIILFVVPLSHLLQELTHGQGLSVDNPWIIPFAGATGAFGAAFSMMINLRTRLAESSFDDLKLNRPYWMVLARILVGIGAGLVLVFFVKSGLLGGDAFPEFQPKGNIPPENGKSGAAEVSAHILTAAEFAKLFIWSFIAGFSEKLVPNLLATTEAGSGKKTPSSYAPPDRPPIEPQPASAKPSQHANASGGESSGANASPGTRTSGEALKGDAGGKGNTR